MAAVFAAVLTFTVLAVLIWGENDLSNGSEPARQVIEPSEPFSPEAGS